MSMAPILALRLILVAVDLCTGGSDPSNLLESSALDSRRCRDALSGAWELGSLARDVDEGAVALNIALLESGFDPNARDATGACGVGQIQSPGMWGTTCERLSSDLSHSYAVLLHVLRASAVDCPGLYRAALTTYVSGKCGVATSVAEARCRRVGRCEVLVVSPEK